MATPSYGGGTTGQQIGSHNTGANVAGPKLIANIASARVQIQDLGPVKVNKSIAPIYVMARKGSVKQPVQAPQFQWYEEDGLPVTVTTTAVELSAGATTLTLASGHGARLFKGMNLWCQRTGEVIHIASSYADTADSPTVIRAQTTTPAAAIIAPGGVAEELQIMTSSFGENSLAPEGLSCEPTLIVNQCQTIRRAFEAGRRTINSQVYGTPEFERMKQDCSDAMMRDVEMSFLFMPGQKTSNTGTTDGTISQGMEAFISNNNFNVAGVANEADLANWLLVWKRMNYSDPSDLVLFGGDGLSRCIDVIGRDNIRYNPDDTIAGIAFDTYQSSVGKFKIKFHPAFSPQYSSVTGANNGLVGQAMGLNIKNIGIATYKGGNLRAQNHIEAIGTDGQKEGLILDQGWILQNERTHINVVGMTN